MPARKRTVPVARRKRIMSARKRQSTCAGGAIDLDQGLGEGLGLGSGEGLTNGSSGGSGFDRGFRRMVVWLCWTRRWPTARAAGAAEARERSARSARGRHVHAMAGWAAGRGGGGPRRAVCSGIFARARARAWRKVTKTTSSRESTLVSVTAFSTASTKSSAYSDATLLTYDARGTTTSGPESGGRMAPRGTPRAPARGARARVRAPSRRGAAAERAGAAPFARGERRLACAARNRRRWAARGPF